MPKIICKGAQNKGFGADAITTGMQIGGKKMARYIDRELALSHPFANGKYDHKNANEDYILGFESYKEWLEQLPTADVRENVHGKWLEWKWVFSKCSICGTIHNPKTKFCPNCGAKMEMEQ